jgi:hypothetical protein
MLRSKFPEYFPPTEAESAKYWKEGIIVPDANVLLNLYRCSKETRESLLKAFEEVKDRLWFPHQVVKEFVKNRRCVMLEQRAIYQSYTAQLPDICKRACDLMAKEIDRIVQRRPSHPVIRKDDIVARIKELCESHMKDIGDSDNSLIEESSDVVLQKVEQLAEGRVGNGFAEKDFESAVKEGIRRLKDRIPPGWMDYRDKADRPDEERCGDWLVWKQILECAKSDKPSAVIFITNDTKVDWWLPRKHGQLLGPDPRLSRELRECSGSQLVLYTTERFLKHANAASEAIEEVRELRMGTGVPDFAATAIERSELAAINEKVAELVREKEALESQIGELELKEGQDFGDIASLFSLKTMLADCSMQIEAAKAEQKSAMLRYMEAIMRSSWPRYVVE